MACEPFAGSIVAVLLAGVVNGMRIMTGQLIETPHDAFMLVAQKELLEFERRERELRKQERLERAKEKFPNLIKELQAGSIYDR